MNYRSSPVLTLLMLVLVQFIFSCGRKKASELIVGKWKVKEVTITKSETAPELVKLLEEEMLSSSYEFGENGILKLSSMRITDGLVGKYRVNDETLIVHIEYASNGLNYKSDYKIEIAGDSRLILRQEFGSGLGEMEAVLEKIK